MMDLDIPEHLVPIRDKIDVFIREKIEPYSTEYFAETDKGDRWSLTERQLELLEGMKAEARKQGLWNFFLPESQGGAGISNEHARHRRRCDHLRKGEKQSVDTPTAAAVRAVQYGQ